MQIIFKDFKKQTVSLDVELTDTVCIYNCFFFNKLILIDYNFLWKSLRNTQN